MNEQNKFNHRYVNWCSSIFEFQFLLNCSFLKRENNDKTEKLDFYLYIKEILFFCYHLTQQEIILIQQDWKVIKIS